MRRRTAPHCAFVNLGPRELEGASFQRPPGLMLRSLVVFDRPSHPHVTCVEASHRRTASLVGLDDDWRSESQEYNQNILMKGTLHPHPTLLAFTNIN